ncbi:MAG TPA: hypothetical protein VGR62_12130 [Candidatus Binatia bacterium]|nr:hypothetical protein [Candidatus Binatia bacterium]
MALLTPLTPDERTTFLVVALPQKTLKKVVGRLGTAPEGVRIDGLSVWDLAWSLVDFYEKDLEVSGLVDKTLRKEVGPSSLADAVAAPDGARMVTWLLLDSLDPARDLAWALLTSSVEGAGELAASLVQTIIADYDYAEEQARKEEEAAAAASGEAPPEPEPEIEDPTIAIVKDVKRARSQSARALKRVSNMKDRVRELEKGLAAARLDLRKSEIAREALDAERLRLAGERDGLRGQLQSGTAGEVTRLTKELETTTRRARSLEVDLDETRDAEATLARRFRTLEEASRVGGPSGQDDDVESGRGSGAGWNVPVFSDEFYESIRRWDRKIVRNAFEKAYRLAEDWRHPSLRAIPLEGLPDYYRLRVATDVRLIYRLLDGNRVELLSLIDREDLSRYVRNAKTR